LKVVLREDESAISEVIGTILILAMTVVLFSTIIIWVGSIPTPVAQTRLDVDSKMAWRLTTLRSWKTKDWSAPRSIGGIVGITRTGTRRHGRMRL